MLSDEPNDDVWSGVRLGPVLLRDGRARVLVGFTVGLPAGEGEDSRERLGELVFDLEEVVATVFDRFKVVTNDVELDMSLTFALLAFPSGADSSLSAVSLKGECEILPSDESMMMMMTAGVTRENGAYCYQQQMREERRDKLSCANQPSNQTTSQPVNQWKSE